MKALEATAGRLGRQDMLQGLTVLLAALCLALAMRWPAGGAVVNDSWAVVAPLRALLLALGALAWGASVGGRPTREDLGPAFVPSPGSPPYGEPAWRTEVLTTLGALVAMTLVTLPFEVLTHAASYPPTGLAWSLAAPPLAVVGHYGLGLWMGRVARSARLSALVPLLVPGTVAGTAWLDVSLGVTVANPWFAALEVAPWFALTMAVTAAHVAWVASARAR